MVDQIDGAPAIRISGQHWGGLITKSAYRDYRLVVEFRWGLLTWGQRKDRARDSGILIHCQGRPGSYQKDFNGAWMRSIASTRTALSVSYSSITRITNAPRRRVPLSS